MEVDRPSRRNGRDGSGVPKAALARANGTSRETSTCATPILSDALPCQHSRNALRTPSTGLTKGRSSALKWAGKCP